MSEFNSSLDLSFERIVDLPPEKIWLAWTSSQHLIHWFTPAPWKTIDCEIDLRPGGIFRTTMLSPDGLEFPNTGCYLEIIPNKKLVWTNAILPGFRPAPVQEGAFLFTAMITLEAQGNNTKYLARVVHQDENGCMQHREMGFEQGWGMALDQLVVYMKNL